MSSKDSINHINKMANAYQISCAVHAASVIGLDQLLAHGPRTVSDLAQHGGFNEALLLRLLRFLGILGVVATSDGKYFAATPLTQHLKEINNMAIGPEAVRAWASLPEALFKDESAYEIANGKSFYNDIAGKHEQRRRWARYNHQRAVLWAQPTAAAIVALLKLGGHETIADLGANSAHLLAALLELRPDFKPMFCELPSSLDTARDNLVEQGLLERIPLVGCDLLQEPPPQADIYILSRVLLNLADKEAETVLNHCRKAMSASSKLVIVEALMPDEGAPHRGAHYLHDLHMMLVWGGKERTISDYQHLLAKVRLQLDFCRDISVDEGNTWQMLVCSPL